MSQGLKPLVVLAILIVFQGCVSLSVKEKFRVDQTINGNAGYVVGEPKIDENAPQDLTRNLLDVGVDSPWPLIKKANPWPLIKKANPWSFIKKADEWTKEYLW